MVEPVHPYQGREFHGFGVAPGTAPADHLGFEQTDDRLGQRIVVTVADAADRGLDASLGQALGVADRDLLRPPIAMMDEPVLPDRSPVVESLLQGIKNEAGLS